jgi:uncharacterized protein YjiS (DUF1127 family)
MLRILYRTMIKSRTKSAAYQTLAMLSDREIADIGHSRASFVDAYIAKIVAELDASDATAASPVNANLVGAV